MPRTNPWTLAVLLFAVAGCSGLTKLDYTHLFSRDGWQRPDRVIESLGIGPGDRVADIGSGEGYFTFKFADAVGPEGRVYAVDVDRDVLRRLRQRVEAGGYSNVVVVDAELDDPLLPDGEVDLAFLCNAYHHLEDRTPYFDRLRLDLNEGGRVAVVEPRNDLLLMKLTGHSELWTPMEVLRGEMRDAHYRARDSFDFLALQHFEVFEAEKE